VYAAVAAARQREVGGSLAAVAVAAARHCDVCVSVAVAQRWQQRGSETAQRSLAAVQQRRQAAGGSVSGGGGSATARHLRQRGGGSGGGGSVTVHGGVNSR
jgi:hypothetical protein